MLQHKLSGKMSEGKINDTYYHLWESAMKQVPAGMIVEQEIPIAEVSRYTCDFFGLLQWYEFDPKFWVPLLIINGLKNPVDFRFDNTAKKVKFVNIGYLENLSKLINNSKKVF